MMSRFLGAVLIGGAAFLGGQMLYAEQPPSSPSSHDATAEQPWLEPMPVPADPELEEQIQELQQALTTFHQQTVRRKEALKQTTDSTQKAKLYEELEALRKERQELEALLHDLIEEAKISEQTAIDEALAHARWFERRREQLEQREELIRDRQE